MPDTRVSALPAASTLSGTEVLPVVQDATSKKATVDQVLASTTAALAGKQATIPPGTYAERVTTLTGVAVQAALDAAQAAGGGHVDLKPNAVYDTLLPIYVWSNTTLHMNGATIRAAASGANLALDHPSSAVVVLRGTTAAVVEDGIVDVNGYTNCLGIVHSCDADATLVAVRHAVQGCRVINATNSALRTYSPYVDLTWDDNLVEDCNWGLTALAAPVMSKGLRITRNRIRNSIDALRVGIQVFTVNTGPGLHSDVLIADNVLRDFRSPTESIPIEANNAGDRIRIRGNTVSTASTRGISTYGGTELSIENNTLVGQSLYAMEIGGTSGVSITDNIARNCRTFCNETLAGCTDVVIDNNIYIGSGLAAPATYAAIFFPNASKRVRITNNIFTNWQHLTQGCVRLGNTAAVEDAVVEGNTFVITDPNTPLLAVQARKAVRSSIVRNTFRVQRDLVAADDYGSPIQIVIDAASSDLLVEGNDIIFTGTVNAAPNAAGVNNGNVGAGALPGLTVRRNKVTRGPRGIRLLVNSTDLLVTDNDTSTCTNANVIPSTAAVVPSDTSDPFGWGLVTNSVGGTPAARVWDTANRAYFWRLTGAATITKIGVKVVVSSGNISLAVYRNSGTGRAAVPGTQLATTGAIACPTAGIDTNVPLGSTVTLQAGDWVGMSCDNNVASFIGQYVGVIPGLLFSGQGGYQTAAHPLPATPALTAVGLPGAAILVGVP